MFDWFWRGKLRNTLLAGFLIFSLVPALVAIVVGYQRTTRNVNDLAIENLKNLTDAKVDYIETWFFERVRFISHVAGMEEVKTMDPARIMSQIEKTQETYRDYRSLLVTNDKGIITASTLAPLGTDLSWRPYVKAALSGYDYISEVLFSVVDQKPIVVIASPITNKGRVVGVIAGTIDLDRINEVVASGRYGRTGEVYLVNRDGIMVTESRFTTDLVSQGVVKNKTSMELKINTHAEEEALHGRSGFGEFKDYRGVEVVSRYRWLPYINMAIVAKQDLNEITDDARAVTRSGTAAAALVAMVFLPLVVVTARKLSHPLEVLAEGADRIAGGNYGVTVNLRSNLEIEALAANFNRMSQELKKSYEKQMEQITLLEEQKQEISVQNEKLAEANTGLEKLSITDQLTGAYNRRYIMRQMEQELAIAIRHGLPLSIILIDIDHFKNVNDTHGHQVGDDVLREIVHVLSGAIRTSDVLGRYGGEEFIVLAPHTGLQDALALAERLRETVSRWPFETTYGFLKLTISLGVSTFDGKVAFGDDKTESYQSSLLDLLLAQSDAEMYKAKALGRNRVSPQLEETAAVNGETGKT